MNRLTKLPCSAIWSLALVQLLFVYSARAQEEKPSTDKETTKEESWQAPKTKRKVVRAPNLMTPAAKKSIASGLKYLTDAQAAQGSFGSGQYAENISITSLSAIALMSAGNMPEEGQYGDNVSRALDFVLKNTGPSGFICVQRSTSHGPMYDHGFGTLFLAEAYGMTRRDDIREKLKKAIKLIVDTQNREGGWRYQPKREPQADVSVTICQIMALRAARNAGIHVPRSTVDRCIDYVKKCQNPDGGFRYMLQPLGASQFPRSAAGVVTFHSAGIYEGKEIDKGLEYLMEHIPSGGGAIGNFRGSNYHYFYGHYYAVQAMYQTGGVHWAKWYPAIRDDLILKQGGDGHWDDNFGPEYATAMACIIMQMPNSVLPIFQN